MKVVVLLVIVDVKEAVTSILSATYTQKQQNKQEKRRKNT